MRGVTLVLAIVAAAVIAVPLLLYLAQERLIFLPRPITEARRAEIVQRTGVESILLQAADGRRLHAWYLAAGDGAPLVIYFGGNAEDVSWMIAEARRHAPGVAWLLTDYRGYGASEGAPAERSLVSDALTWFDHAAERLGARQVFVLGRSLGSALAVRVAAERPVAGVIAIAPFDSLTAVARHYYPFLPVRWLLKHPFDSASLEPRVSAPLLCLVAGADEIIPAERSRRLYDAWAGPKTWVELEGARHNETDDSPSLWASIQQFLARER